MGLLLEYMSAVCNYFSMIQFGESQRLLWRASTANLNQKTLFNPEANLIYPECPAMPCVYELACVSYVLTPAPFLCFQVSWWPDHNTSWTFFGSHFGGLMSWGLLCRQTRRCSDWETWQEETRVRGGGRRASPTARPLLCNQDSSSWD